MSSYRLSTLFTLLASVAAALILSELTARLVLDKVDFLEPELQQDPRYGRRVVPGSAGHDAWGFRNKQVPAHADIVAVGDSQTYGISAPATASWPRALARLTGRSVYSAALGGYGPLEYSYVVQDYVDRLSPTVVLVGLYFGNDLADAYRGGARNNPSSSDQDRELAQLDTPETERFGSNVRRWFAVHSVLYRVVTLNMSRLVDPLRFVEASSSARVEGEVTVPTGALKTVFQVTKRHKVMNLHTPAIKTGLRMTLRALDDVFSHCRERKYSCAVVLIPTKESVYHPYVKNSLSPEDEARLATVVRAEARVRGIVAAHLAARRFAFVDALPALRAAASKEPVYPRGNDGHPNAAGYAAIAEAVHRHLSEPGRGGSPE